MAGTKAPLDAVKVFFGGDDWLSSIQKAAATPIIEVKPSQQTHTYWYQDAKPISKNIHFIFEVDDYTFVVIWVFCIFTPSFVFGFFGTGIIGIGVKKFIGA
jgi:hypothetical protein